jgi:nucleotide-binding universal stress UspA family protein
MYQRILVPVDGSSTASRGLDEALKLARLTGARLRLIHVLDVLGFAASFEAGAIYGSDLIATLRQAGELILEQGRARVAASGVPVDTLLCESFAARTADALVEQAKAWNADLIVIGTHGRRGVSRLMLGSDAEQLIRSAPVPVLLVRSPENGVGLGAALQVNGPAA